MTTRNKRVAGAGGPAINPVQRVKLLARVAAYYHRCFVDNPEGLRYLTKARGLHDISLIKQFQIGLATGSLLEVLPADEETLSQLISLGVLTESRRELLNGCVVFPLWSQDGVVVNLYGRRLVDGEDNHWWLPSDQPGFWNLPAIRRSSSLLLAPSILDALTAIDNGLTETIPCDVVHGFTEEQLQFLVQSGVKRLVVACKGTDAGRSGAEKLTAQLKTKGFAVASLALPDGEDINSYLTSRDAEDARKSFHAKVAEAFASLASENNPTVPVAVPGELYEHTEHGFKLTLHGRAYHVLGFSREPTQLKVALKAVGDPRKGFELRNFDFYSANSRQEYTRACMKLFGAGEPVIKADLARVLECIEAWRPKETVPAVPTPSPEETARALAFLRNPDLFDEILTDLKTLGIAGEETNKLLCYLAVVSRKLDDPLSLLIQSRSAAGKSALQNTVLTLVPEEDKVVYTRMTDQSLFYQGRHTLVHKVLALEETEGLGGTAYPLRALQSSKHLYIVTTTKDPVTGKMKTENYEVQGPVAVLSTTTSAKLDEETASRFLTLTIDESKDMTETILAAQRHRDTLEGYLAELDRSTVIAKHQTAQRLLEPLVVINPYAEQLTFPVHSLRARRDHKKYLMLIKAITFLYQKQRPIKQVARDGQSFSYIEVTKDDIRRANDLATQVLGHSLDELSAPARNLLKRIHTMVQEHCAAQQIAPAEYIFTRRLVREKTGWTNWQVRAYTKELRELEYLMPRAGAPGKEYVYELAWDGGDDDQKFQIALADPDRLTEAP